ncbi:uncharacterized protein LOC110054557 isoform X3 [Orbicella faveolata]|uniref:uncharacterized protein LOC110054557 isoform X3 n=1 Tax=Orbicella faveolata TaxID=48498 RepID=UPI0009E19689|nr:uncharacterized protein LOC110054557 isoform X3 [Orbicella faveolata]
MSEYEYSGLLFDISEKLDVNKLSKLLFMCRKDIAQGSERNIRDVRSLFTELEKQNRIGIDRLENLKEILTQMKKPSLRKKVEEFEIRRKAQSVGIVSSLKRAATCIKGAIKLVCNFRTIAGGLLVVTSGMALRSCSSLDEFVEAFSKVVLVSYSKLAEISEGSLCFTVQAETSSALKELWDIYKDGTLQNRLQEFLVTDEIKQLASGEDVAVTVYIDEQEYKAAYLDLMLLQKEESDATEEEQLGARGRSRRNSDSFLGFKQSEDDVTLMKLEHAENKWAFERQRRQFLEEENKKLRTEIAVAGNVQRRSFWQQEESDHTFQRRLEDLSEDVIRQLKSRLQGDHGATRLIYQSFRVPFQGSMNIFKLFPDTPVKLFVDVLEALQLYDLVDLLSEIPQPVRSLRPALPLQEIEKLRKTTDPRPTTYHSNVAVLIITGEKNSFSEGIERFFKGFGSKSDVTVFEWKRLAYGELKSRLSRPERLDERERQRRMQEIRKEMETNETAVSAVIERWIHNQGNYSLFAVFVAEMFRMFESTYFFGEAMKRLVSEIPDKIKFFIGSWIPVSVRESSESLVVIAAYAEYALLERLMLDILNKRWQTLDLISMMEELKRSVTKEHIGPRKIWFNPAFPVVPVLTDSLSSRPRFKKEEDPTDSA